MLVDQMPTCFACPDDATRWRRPGADKWGMDPLQNYKMLDEEEAYELWEERGVPDDVYATCDAHFLYRPDDQGNAVLTLAGQRQRSGGGKPSRVSPGARAKERKRALRDELIQRLGGECGECGETDAALLCVVWPFPRRPVEESSPAEWYLWLLDNPAALGRCVLLCVRHPRTEGPSKSMAERTARALDAYGGKCGECGTAEGALWIVAVTATAPHYPGGRKMGSRDKVRWLESHGWPPGFELRCPPCGRERTSS